jgi:hypothetical protein
MQKLLNFLILEKNILKQKASINNGYNFEFWIFNNKGQIFNRI